MFQQTGADRVSSREACWARGIAVLALPVAVTCVLGLGPRTVTTPGTAASSEPLPRARVNGAVANERALGGVDRQVDSEQNVPAADSPVNPNWINDLVPGELCGTYQHYLATSPRNGALAATCAELGLCDDPVNRDASIPTQDTPISTYRLSIHVFCDDSGGNCAATQTDIDTAVARLNVDYAPWQIQFVHETEFIASTKYRTLDSSEQWFMKKTYADSPATRLNVYVVDTGGASWGTFPWDQNALTKQGGIVIHDYWFGANSPLPTILTHEVGHCLGLWHTFHGVDEVTRCSDCYEPAGRPAPVGDVTGDWCSDTNPTPKNTNNCFDPSGTDFCSGNPWVATPYLNYMGYSHTCPIEFTPQQAGRMHCWTAAWLTGWLQLPGPPNAPGTPTLTSLGGGEILVAWADNSQDESGFRVQREKKSKNKWINTQIIANVGPDITFVTDAPGAGMFRYRVRAYNELGDSAWSGWAQINN